MNLDPNLPPPKPGPRIRFITPRNTQPEKYLVISSRVWAHHVHWIGAHTQPCSLVVGHDGQPTTSCTHCDAQRPTRWKGYLHVLPPHSLQAAFLCLTPNAGWELLEEIKKGVTLRGVTLEVWRAGKHATALLMVRIASMYGVKDPGLEELDPGPYLDTVFRKRPPLSDSI